MTNKWYVIAIEDTISPFGCKQITPKGEWFPTLEEANWERIYQQPDYEDRLIILERTCTIVKM
jgi:hypothetical protein